MSEYRRRLFQGDDVLPPGDPGTVPTCPACGVSWAYQVNGETYSRLIGIEYQGGYDGVSEWRCPDCRAGWDRFTGERISLSEKATPICDSLESDTLKGNTLFGETDDK